MQFHLLAVLPILASVIGDATAHPLVRHSHGRRGHEAAIALVDPGKGAKDEGKGRDKGRMGDGKEQREKGGAGAGGRVAHIMAPPPPPPAGMHGVVTVTVSEHATPTAMVHQTAAASTATAMLHESAAASISSAELLASTSELLEASAVSSSEAAAATAPPEELAAEVSSAADLASVSATATASALELAVTDHAASACTIITTTIIAAPTETAAPAANVTEVAGEGKGEGEVEVVDPAQEEGAGAGAGAGAEGIDVGPCTDFSMTFATGLAGAANANEFRFAPTDSEQFSQGAALNPAIISNAMCDTFVNQCAKSATTRDVCKEVKAMIDAELDAGVLVRDQGYADAWLLGLEDAFGFASTGRGTSETSPAV